MKIAIVANGPLTRNLAPFGKDWEMWGLGYPAYRLSWQDKFDKLFELHNYKKDDSGDDFTFSSEYVSWMEKNSVFIRDDLPWESLKALSSPDGFDSSMAIMIAYAILQMPDEIGVWGIDARIMDEEEYKNQWPNILWLLGIAKGCGITVRCPSQSGLFTQGDYGAQET